MRVTLNAHRVFRGAPTRPGYLKALNIDGGTEQMLRNARGQIREALRKGIPLWQDPARKRELIEDRYLSFAAELPTLRPRFRMQGSGVYHTLNDPAHKPPQEVDYDDGMFLPTSFISGNGLVQPIIAAKGYFRMVESILEPLCKRNGWQLDRSKPTCVRIRINSEAHIDLPLYAIPDEDFVTLVEARAATRDASREATDDLLLAEQVYRGLPKDRIMLARRDKGWSESDPRQIEDWFLDAVKEHGEVIRFICRYLKGWRDFQWQSGGPSSITLMACTVSVFDELSGTLADNRDDIALQIIANRLPELFSDNIPNPVLPNQKLDEKWTHEDRIDFVARASGLKDQLARALNDTFHKSISLKRIRGIFGDRIPNDESLLSVDTEEREIMNYKPAAVAAPYVPRTKSG